MSSDLDGDTNGDGIVDEMDRVRSNLGGDIDLLGDRMRKMMDWQSYVRSAPLTSVGAALLVGFLVAPRLRFGSSHKSSSAGAPAPGTPSALTSEPSLSKLLTNVVLGGLAQAGSAYIGDLLARHMKSATDPFGTGEPPESAEPF